MEITPGMFILKVVTLDNLRPFDLNPRKVRNPLYDEIKESIRQRGLEQQLQITQRPGEKFFIITNGGNTRLSILNELWLETHDKKFWEFSCLYKEWEAKNIDEGNLQFLLSHLIENDMHGSLTYIERALGVRDVSSLYSSVYGPLSLNKMSQFLRSEGYPVSPSEISKMEAMIHLLLPHIPEALYGGLSRNTVEQLLRLRSNTSKYWESYCQKISADEERQLPSFDDIFAMALLPFNTQVAGFHVEHIQDELTGLVSQALGVDYNTVALVTDAQAQKRSSILGELPVPELPAVSEQRAVGVPQNKVRKENAHDLVDETDEDNSKTENETDEDPPFQVQDDSSSGTIGHQNATVNELCDVAVPSSVVDDSAVFMSGHEAISGSGNDLWHIDPLMDTPDALASLIDQTAWELAEICGLEHLLIPAEPGQFTVASLPDDLPNERRVYWQLLAFIAGQQPGSAAIWRQMLLGSKEAAAGVSDEAVIKLVQLIRFIRRFYEKCQGGA